MASDGHVAAAFMSGSTGNKKKGSWGYSAAGAQTRVNLITKAGSVEVALFTLLKTAPWWPPILRQFLAGNPPPSNATVAA